MADQRYRVIKRLEAGGMAEVYLGEASSLEGFKKRVAIKRVLPHLAQNENFIQMFLDEARLSARLSHANIVSVFDISARDDTYFLIMEFVDGANLKRILESLQRRGQRFPLPEAIYVCAEACRGLSYAHELHDEHGHPIGIVHRDISPPNIMITKQGEIKVADFGLAKAGTQLSQTDPGVVKGKFSYLSPEAAAGREVDARADIFSLGIVLWEMLAGRRLFLGETDYATVKLIQQANIPRLAPLNNSVDETFEELLLKALTRAPEDRYPSAQAFGDALTGYLFARQLKVTHYDIATLVNTAISEDAPSSKNESSLIDRLIQEELDGSIALRNEHLRAVAANAQHHEGDLEDPASWFDHAETEMPALLSQRPAQTPSQMRWHERGVEYEPTGKFDTPPAGDDDITSVAATRAAAPPAPPPPRKAPAAASSSTRMETAAVSDAPTSPANLNPIPTPQAAPLKPKSKSMSGTSIAMIIGAALLAMAALALVLLRSRL
ncbi:MAG TPA: serine/threonine-protein kinase [Polyangiales bacterium]|nr:serine/threonine-protein kinase [Polyangiales bacterium]